MPNNRIAEFALAQATLDNWWHAATAEVLAKQAAGSTTNFLYGDEHYQYPPRDWSEAMTDWHNQRPRLERQQSLTMSRDVWAVIEQFAADKNRADMAAIRLTGASGALEPELAALLAARWPAGCHIMPLIGADLLCFMQQAGPVELAGRMYRLDGDSLTGEKPTRPCIDPQSSDLPSAPAYIPAASHPLAALALA